MVSHLQNKMAQSNSEAEMSSFTILLPLKILLQV